MKIAWSALLWAFCVALAVPAHAQDDVSAFYRGKQLRMIVGSAAGGGYDLFARIVARHIVDHIPGHPTIIVQNQPAAGGVVMANQLFAQGPKDGTVIAVPINGLPTAPLLQTGTQFDATKLIWLGSTNREAYVAFVWHTVPVERVAELAAKEVVVGATTPGPTMLEFAKSDADRQAMTMLFARTEYGRPYFLPPDVPAERVTALRRAFDATMKDQAFIAEAAKLQFEVD